MYKPSDMYFCIHRLSELDQSESTANVITFCPITYWNEHKYLPDEHLPDNISFEIQDGYKWHPAEEMQWLSRKSSEEIRYDLNRMGFGECFEMYFFLLRCYQ